MYDEYYGLSSKDTGVIGECIRYKQDIKVNMIEDRMARMGLTVIECQDKIRMPIAPGPWWPQALRKNNPSREKVTFFQRNVTADWRGKIYNYAIVVEERKICLWPDN